MKFKRYLAAGFALALCLVLTAPTAMAVGTVNTSSVGDDPAAFEKNETVYAMLNGDGSVSRIYVVNQLMGEYTDYGEYTDIKNLSTSSTPTIDGDMITFSDENITGGLYYQGAMTGELPLTFDLSYTLNGQSTSAESLPGTNGHLELRVIASPNEKCRAAIREGLMAQITVKMDTQYADNINAPDATVVTVGKTATISYVVLPGETGDLTIDADVQDFCMDAITITMLKGTIAASGINEKLDEFDDGFDDMLGGADDMVEGTTELKDGMSSLLDGVGSLSSGLGKLGSGGKTLLSGMAEYGDNLDGYLSAVQGVAQSSTDIVSGLQGLSENGAAVSQGVSDISSGLSGLSNGGTDLKALAESLVGSTDPSVAALANGVLQTLGTVDGLADGLESASGGLGVYVSGVQQTTAGYQQFNDGLQTLAESGSQLGSAYDGIKDGVSEYTGGVSRSASGAKKIYKSIKNLPDDIQSLIDGQLEFRDGIATAKDEMNDATSLFVPDDAPPVSFASPDKNYPDSVQYILTTTAIEKKAETELRQEESSDNGDFITRLVALFK